MYTCNLAAVERIKLKTALKNLLSWCTNVLGAKNIANKRQPAFHCLMVVGEKPRYLFKYV